MRKKDVSLCKISNEWLEENKLLWKPSTYSKYFHIVNDIVADTLSDITILNLTEKVVQENINKMIAQNRSISYIRDYVTVINSVLRYASNKEYNCLTRLHVIYPKQRKKEMQYLSRKQQEILINYLLENPDFIKIGVVFALYTGLRCGELCALRWSDINLDEKTVLVSKTLQRIQSHDPKEESRTKILVMPPKSDDSFRLIPIPDFLVKILIDYKPKQIEAFFLTGSSEKLMEPRCLQNKFKMYIAACNLENINFHALRHTFATRCIEVGFDMKTLSEILGHANIKTTLELYVHSSFELKVDNMKKLNTIAIK